jgi:hypothetical protein
MISVCKEDCTGVLAIGGHGWNQLTKSSDMEPTRSLGFVLDVRDGGTDGCDEKSLLFTSVLKWEIIILSVLHDNIVPLLFW